VNHLFVTQDYAPDVGGMARRHVEICRRFAPDGVLVSTVASPAVGTFDRGEGYSIIRQPFPFQRANRFINQLRWAASLADLARTTDIIHCGNIRPVGYGVWWAHRRTGTPYLVYVNGGDLLREARKRRNWVKRWSAARIFESAAGVVATSDWVAELTHTVMNRIGVRARPEVRAIALGTDPNQFTPAANRGQLRQRWQCGHAPILLTVARLVPHKGQDLVIRALPALLHDFPELRYVIVGEGHDEARLRGLAAELNVTGSVIFAGSLSEEDVPEAYATATIYVGMSRLDRDVNVEGFGISFLEASASGIPVVAGDSGGVRSAVRDGETGVVIPSTDLRALTAIVRKLLTDPDLRALLGANGRRAVEEYFNWDRVAAETKAFARQAVGTADSAQREGARAA
jgi:phosphatidylinositol alpha-1,6-mannosyltransferase